MGYYLVTGATGVLGKEFCRGLLARGKKELFLTGRSAEKLSALADELSAIGEDVRIVTFSCSLSDPEEIGSMFRFADGKGISFSGYIAVAGVDTQKAFEKYDEKKIVGQIRVNDEGNLLCFRAALERRDAGVFDVLCVASMCGTVPIPYFALYSASKAFLISFYSAVRKELSSARVSVLVPGSIPTRPDVVADIEKQGITAKLSAKSPAFVVRKGLDGLEKNKRIVVPGLWNRFNYVMEKIVPTAILLSFTSGHWKKKEKDAF